MKTKTLKDITEVLGIFIIAILLGYIITLILFPTMEEDPLCKPYVVMIIHAQIHTTRQRTTNAT